VLQSRPLRDRHPPVVDRHELDDLFSLTYEELRRLAARVKGGNRQASLSPTALVNEAWLKLAGAQALRPESQLHFKRIAACAMRQVLVDAARRRHADKRGGEMPFVTLDESVDQIAATSRDLIALDAALNDLASIHPRQAAMVECRYFSGLDVTETAALLNVSEATVLRDWRAAKAWLAAQVVKT
jgi:RNA polymerase sigma factor (TIGR02999 family)